MQKLKEKFKRFFWHSYWTDPVIFFSLVLAILLNLGMWIAVWQIVEPASRPIILHYNVYFGVDSIGDWRNVFLMPALAAVIFLVNAVLSRFFYYKERLASYLFAAMALLVQLLMAVGLGSVILINF
ncbi:MAG: hypothetical protein UX02_C0002G0155 [Candidatus Moranbacteria bacterium GW2011_GWC1_45_18]|nr:MAG: hypothetical protein UT79_C0001G0306 [Candidatus Moranbacteria bacterium GW2011_GWC2_40_12]KKT33938.1 MAG: hypothetical protein UW19_C0004G0068 [Candidatus Moranbacteria bacterium GW2011_GWF2_44_10]KKT99836.1 MAG: hypothetical protein UX02_C0002G0155 [Candidatus Moranbacteria bacterium GW2011_GWC1_45_18]OGI36670.1 MAG: hypothetical protein A2407_03865 [Candidatus Moranbacteria bacterium RIFOXYC1_FULL_44_8]OGI40821.1 MAG: hypothetical protein A2374_02205 [Candidatus Moranbacteria bacteri